MLHMPFILFSFNDPPTTAIYTLSLHDALPISSITTAASFSRSEAWYSPSALITLARRSRSASACRAIARCMLCGISKIGRAHSELQSPMYLVCRLLLEKKKKTTLHLNDNHKLH